MKAMNNFVNLYSVSKTLRFELKPIGKDGNRLNEQESDQVFKEILEQDKKIKAAYIALKPVMDRIHEEIINKSLTSEEARQIDFSEYFNEYQKGKQKKIDGFETALRERIGKTFENAVMLYTITKLAKKKEEQKAVFEIKKNVPIAKAEIIDYLLQLYKDDSVLQNHIKEFKGFFGYFSGYNTNRSNYYEYKKEANTAVASRIVHENLPKFCDNAIQFENRKNDYLRVLEYLQENNRITQIKDAEVKAFVEINTIDEQTFKIDHFAECLAQSGIDEYNRIIGHYNYLINLFNQAHKVDNNFKKLSQFKTLFKQIGCGKRSLFSHIKYNTAKEQKEANEKSDEALNLEETFALIDKAGKQYFSEQKDDTLTTIYTFIKWLKENDDWDGVYWSKAAMDKVSTKYFANWHDIKDRIQYVLQHGSKEQKEAIKSVATYNKKREEQLKINDAVELSGLFEMLNQEPQTGWSKSFFKESILEKREAIIDESKTPGKNLINLICADMEDFAKEFCDKSTAVIKITDYKKEDNILAIKEWLDRAKWLLWLVKFFEVKESKVKGSTINPQLTNMLSALLHCDDADWFDWYDLVRNYLSRKPQDDAKENKLKLNFENSCLLGGWSDGQEKNKGAVLLKSHNKYYVGILKQRNIFDTEKDNNPIYNANDNNIGRLILRNLKFQTLAGKGFGTGNDSYGVIGKSNPNEAMKKLQVFIMKNYVQKYPLLKEVSEKRFADKKTFDSKIQEVLKECYECNFTPINWDVVLQHIENGNLFLFEIYSKDFSETKGEKSTNSKVNLQTMYWHHLFDNNSTIQLNGGGEIFFREEVELQANDKVIHYANEKIRRRSDEKVESIFNHDIIKNKRFTKNKFFFHVPIKINYQASSPSQAKVNETVNDNFTQTSSIQFLGIDRGEKHLIYYSLIDSNGSIIEQDHFDTINTKDYLHEINEAAKKRREKQENWQQKGNISNLKDGYISLVVHEIIEKMKDKDGNYKPTFIVLEDLNTGFKRSRQKFEQQVYQKFELALAKKLNYLVDKSKKMGELASVSNALQLTPAITNYGDIENRKQLGVMLYTRANYTSVTDPATGWRKTIYLNKGSETDVKKQILASFTEIGMDDKGDYFFQYKDENAEKTWTLWSGKDGKSLERYRARRGKDKNEYIVETYDVKDLLDKLFQKFDKSKSLKQQIKEGVELQKVNDHTAWETLRFVIDIVQQIRNSGDVNNYQDDNFLLSPVRGEKGEHFDSRISGSTLPKDADANGAYNIARKGIIMHEHIKHWVRNGKPSFEKSSDLDLFVSDKEWDIWCADKTKWQEELKIFASKKAKVKETS